MKWSVQSHLVSPFNGALAVKTNHKTMFKKIISAITGFFTKEKPVVEDAFTKAIGLVNVIKTFEGSVTGQTIEAILDLVFPGAAPAILTGLHNFLSDFGFLTNLPAQASSDPVANGLSFITKLQGNSKTIALSNLAAVIAHTAQAANGGDATLQQAIISAPIVYNPAVLDQPEAE